MQIWAKGAHKFEEINSIEAWKLSCLWCICRGNTKKKKKKDGRYVPPRFSKAGCPELIFFFFFFKLESWELIFDKICVSEAEI